jgi:signal transduction histidine kinase/DNA-binding response OmpR family regulator
MAQQISALEQSRIRYLADGNSRAQIFGMMIATVFVFVAYGSVPTSLLLLWYGLMACVCATRWFLLKKLVPPTDEIEPKHEMLTVAGSLVTGCTWGIAPFLLGFEIDSTAFTSITIMMAAVGIGASFSSAVSWKALSAFILPLFGCMVAYYLVYGGSSHLALAFTISIYVLFLYFMTMQLREVIFDRFNSGLSLERTNAALEEQIEATKKADALSEAKSMFLATMSHEIRTPMNGILGFANILADTKLDDQQRMCVETVRTSGKTLLSILNDILDVSKIEAGAMELEESSFNIQDVIENCALLFNPQANAKGLDLVTYVDPNIPMALIGDSERLTQVVSNLVNNAIKFTEVGTVGVEITAGERRASGKQSITIKVSDTGIGIPQEKLATIFDRFAQADNSTTRKFGGTGLGLAICKEITELMGGTIMLESELGNGTTFTINLALNVTDPPAESLKSELDLAALLGKRILVVDDNKINLTYFRNQLEAYGLRCRTVMSGYSALELLTEESQRLDAVIIDHLMPGMDGFELAREIRKRADCQHLGLILSSSAGLSTHNEAIDQGFDATVPKPIRQTELVDGLHKAVGKTPANDADDIMPALPVAKLQITPTTRRILLAEDNAINRELVEFHLHAANYTVDSVANGVEAVNAIKTFDYDLVLMDLRMPEMDGIAATELIRSTLHPQQNVPIIALTANVMPSDREACIKAGMDDFLAKPLDPMDLVEKIEYWTSKHLELEDDDTFVDHA